MKKNKTIKYLQSAQKEFLTIIDGTLNIGHKKENAYKKSEIKLFYKFIKRGKANCGAKSLRSSYFLYCITRLTKSLPK